MNMSNFAEDRLAICNACPYNESGDCILCGCPVNEKVEKLEESCPLLPAKWDKAVSIETEKGAESTGRITAQPTPPPRRPPCVPCSQR